MFTKAHPLHDCLFFHFNGWIIWTFFVLYTCFYYPKRNILTDSVTAIGVIVSLHFLYLTLLVEVTSWKSSSEYLNFSSVFLSELSINGGSIDNYINLNVFIYSCWFNVYEGSPTPRLNFFHFNGWILWTFFVLYTCFYYPNRNMLAVTVTASGVMISLNICNSHFWSRSTDGIRSQSI